MELPDIKQSLSIETVLNHYGLQPDKNNMLKCPFPASAGATAGRHTDQNASLKIYPNTNTFNCFGCGANGDQIEFIQLKEKCNKHEAILKAKTLLGYAVPEPKRPDYIKLFESFKYAFQRSPKAKGYLKSRNLTLTEVGYNTGNKYDKLKHCIVFPLKNSKGQTVSLYGRSILDKENAKHFYTPNRKGLYPRYPKTETTKLILTEAIIDAATLLQIPEITTEYEILSCYGTNGLTEEHKRAIIGLNQLQEIIFFFDGDQAGTEAINKQAETLQELKPGIRISQVETPKDEDINSLLESHEPEILHHLIQERKPINNIQSGTGEFTGSVPEPKSTDALAEVERLATLPGKFDSKNPDFITYTTTELQIIILGGINMQQLDRLRITIKISRADTQDSLHSIRHTLDLYHSDYLEKFINKASEQLETGTNILRRTVAKLTDQIEKYRLRKIESLKEQKPHVRQLTEQRKQKAITYLSSPNLMQRTNEDIGITGMIGEAGNRLLMYLVFTSRLREQPLHIISLGASGTGKTYLQEKISELIPEHHKLEITILSENAFYYFDQKELKNRPVLIEDMDGAENVLYPLRELQSKKRISKTIPIKDNKGNLKTITLKVEGPICLAGTTTRERLYEDNANRSILIYLDNTAEHKELIMDYQRKLSAGKIETRHEEKRKEFFKDMQQVLKSIKVRNPYAEQLKIPEYVFKPLRTNSHYLAFIETITFYHQYQRRFAADKNTGERYVETTLEDIEWANRLLKDVLLAKSDELPKQIREFFEWLKYHTKATQKESFYAKEIRNKLRLNPMTVNRYLRELEARGYIRKVGGNRKAGFEYEVLNWTEYSELQRNMNVLDEILLKIRTKYNGSVTTSNVILNAPVSAVN